IERIAPKLTGTAERIGGNPRHVRRPAPHVEVEQLRMRPGLDAIVCDVHRHVAEQAHTEQDRASFERAPLAIERPLHDLVKTDLVAGTGACAGERGGLALSERRVPFGPRLIALSSTERAK